MNESLIEFIQSEDSRKLIILFLSLIFFSSFIVSIKFATKSNIISNRLLLFITSIYISFSFYISTRIFQFGRDLFRNYSELSIQLTAIILLFIFYFLLIHLRNIIQIKTRLFKLIFTCILTIFSYPYLIALSFPIWFQVSEYYPDRKFNIERWLEKPDKRYEMLKDLKPQLVGKSIRQINELLIDGVTVAPDSSMIYIWVGIRPPVGWGAQSGEWCCWIKNGKFAQNN